MNLIEHPRLYRALGTIIEIDEDNRKQVEQDLWRIFGDELAILIVDMSHFTHITQQHGIVYYLSMIKRMQDTVALSLPRHNGKLVKFSADNSFAVFNSPDDAVNCILEINAAMKAENQKTPKFLDVELCAGIDFGKVLNINNKEVYGGAVNIASKLGEDTAEAWEVLVSDRAFKLLKDNSKYHVKPRTIDNKNTPLEAWLVKERV